MQCSDLSEVAVKKISMALEIEVLDGGRMIEEPLPGRVGFDVFSSNQVNLLALSIP